MKTFKIDASECEVADDFYDLLFSVLASPEYHGRILDALWDSITSDINSVSPPYVIEVSGYEHVPVEVAELITRIQKVFAEAKKDKNIEAALRFI